MTAAGIALGLAAVLAGGCAPDRAPDGARPAPVLIYAAASLAPVLEDCFAGDASVAISAASSAVLAKQIEAGAPADVFLSADPQWLQWLEERGHVQPGSRFDFAGNGLVVVGAAGSSVRWDPERPQAFPDSFAGRLALGDPDHVPAGAYARDALQHAGIWGALAGRVLGAADARAACVLVERGECEAGILYASDARASGGLRIAGEIPDSWHDPIVYAGAVCAERARPETERVIETLRSAATRARLQARGFRSPEGAAWNP